MKCRTITYVIFANTMYLQNYKYTHRLRTADFYRMRDSKLLSFTLRKEKQHKIL